MTFVYEKGKKITVGSHGSHEYAFANGKPVTDADVSRLVYESGTGIGGAEGAPIDGLYPLTEPPILETIYGGDYDGMLNPTDNIDKEIAVSGSSIESFDYNFSEYPANGSYPGAWGISADIENGTFWIIDADDNWVGHITRDGSLYDAAHEWDHPNGASRIAVDPRDGTIWTINNALDRFEHYTRDGSQIGSATDMTNGYASGDIQEARGIAIDPIDFTVWIHAEIYNVYSNDSVFYHMDMDGNHLGEEFPSAGTYDNYGLEIDPFSGHIVTGNQASPNRFYAMDRSGAVQWETDNTTNPQGVTLDPVDGSIWSVDTFDTKLKHIPREITWWTNVNNELRPFQRTAGI